MQCIHCSAWNDDEERRCTRCGRRLRPSAPRPAPEIYPLTGAAAPAFETLAGGRTSLAPLAPNVPFENPQPSLFREPMQGPKIVPIPVLTPRARGIERKAPRGAGSRVHAGGHRETSQQSLDFFHGAYEPNPLGTEVEAVIYCDAPVALPIHRLMAAGADASMIAIAVASFLMIFYLSGGPIVFSKPSLLLFGAVIGVVAIFYRLLFCLGNGDTPGMQFAGLRLVNFDGRLPGRRQRLMRLAVSLLSVVSAGLGLVWALVDEENLTWHDHISKTFPSPG